MARQISLKCGDLICVLWADAHGPSTQWEYSERLDDTAPLLCESVGWVVDQSKTALRISSNRTEDQEQLVGLFVIPLAGIKKIRKLQ